MARPAHGVGIPIGVRDVPEAQDEPDSSVLNVYELLDSGASDRAMVPYPYRIDVSPQVGGKARSVCDRRAVMR